MPLSLWLLITAIIITAGAHVPVRGRSLRDRLRRTEPGQLIGLRLTPGLRSQLSAADIVSLADDSPVTLDALCFYHIAPEIRGEHAHRYFRAAERSGTAPEPWTHLVATLPVEASADKALRFLIHRLGTLGIRARRLTAPECALTESSAEVVQLRRTGRSHHVAALGRKPHLWLSRQRDIAITNGPAQVIGAGSSGQTITMCPAKLPRLEVDCGNQDICELLIGMLSLGYRVGIRTARPHFYTVALDLGAVLLARAGDDTVDVVVVEEYEPDLCTGIARIIEVSRTGSPTAAAAEMPASCPRLAMGEFTWTLSTARTTDELQPLAMRATSGSVPESTHPNLADRPAPGSRQAHPAAPGHSERHFLGHPADRLLQEAHPPSASVHR
ncbi:hypothetical protein CHU72_04370 [Corynebacterium sp. LK12]|uniref:hypothetical protein n=1 Tax=Corynebacterium sp. LK12 TaxID=2022658 RepID=UPI0011C8F7D2|nr:hypothetical protein [Corynebacterium sp. LK12]TXS81953.1 hypothetical protein CHU72_04370 [Corynebacterium sp. LK12]